MTRKQLKDQITQISAKCKNIRGLVTVLTKQRNLNNLKTEIYNQTNYLDPKCKITERLFHIAYEMNELPKCKFCNTKKTQFIHFNSGYREYCSIKCAQQSDNTKKKREQTTLKKYGVRITSQNIQVKEKMKQNNIKKFGGIAPIHSKEVQEKTIQTNLRKYGTITPLQNEEVKNKIIQTNLERYGVKNPLQNQDVKDKQIQTNLKRYGVRSTTQVKSIKEKQMLSTKKINYEFISSFERLGNEYELLTSFEDYIGVKYHYLKFKHKKCNHTFKYVIANGKFPRCPKCFPNNKSTGEIEIGKFCDQYFNNIVYSSKSIISPLELDIYIPEIKLAIEFNGIYWHSEQHGKDKNYHLNKTKLCNSLGIQLIHIFEDEWIEKQDIVKSILLNKFGKIKKSNRIFARKCEIGIIRNIDAKRFMFDNHLQGFINGTHIGLVYKNKLISMVTVGKSRFDKNNSLELYRFCSLLDHQVVGGLSRLIKYVERNLKPKNIVTYADLRFGTGEGYLSTGFKFDSVTAPNYYYIRSQKRESRMNYQKHKLKDKLEFFDKNLTEEMNMFNHNYHKIWDCGNVKFIQKFA